MHLYFYLTDYVFITKLVVSDKQRSTVSIVFGSDLSEDGHVDGSVFDSVAIARFVHVDVGNPSR